MLWAKGIIKICSSNKETLRILQMVKKAMGAQTQNPGKDMGDVPFDLWLWSKVDKIVGAKIFRKFPRAKFAEFSWCCLLWLCCWESAPELHYVTLDLPNFYHRCCSVKTPLPQVPGRDLNPGLTCSRQACWPLNYANENGSYNFKLTIFGTFERQRVKVKVTRVSVLQDVESLVMQVFPDLSKRWKG